MNAGDVLLVTINTLAGKLLDEGWLKSTILDDAEAMSDLQSDLEELVMSAMATLLPEETQTWDGLPLDTIPFPEDKVEALLNEAWGTLFYVLLSQTVTE